MQSLVSSIRQANGDIAEWIQTCGCSAVGASSPLKLKIFALDGFGVDFIQTFVMFLEKLGDNQVAITAPIEVLIRLF